MTRSIHLTTFLSGLLLTVIGLALTAEGLGWWDLGRDDLRYFMPVVLILLGGASIAHALQRTEGVPDTATATTDPS